MTVRTRHICTHIVGILLSILFFIFWLYPTYILDK